MATFTKLNSGSWRVQVRRKGKYVNDAFVRRKDAEEWAIEVERRIDRGEPTWVEARVTQKHSAVLFNCIGKTSKRSENV